MRGSAVSDRLSKYGVSPVRSLIYTATVWIDMARPLQNAAFRAHKSFSTPQRLASASKAKRSLSFAFLTPLEPCCDGGVPRKIFEIALQAAFFKGLMARYVREIYHVKDLEQLQGEHVAGYLQSKAIRDLRTAPCYPILQR